MESTVHAKQFPIPISSIFFSLNAFTPPHFISSHLSPHLIPSPTLARFCTKLATLPSHSSHGIYFPLIIINPILLFSQYLIVLFLFSSILDLFFNLVCCKICVIHLHD
ncbi:hypothetical protein Droror1_Dr00007710 [Drosera rotundifolia]